MVRPVFQLRQEEVRRNPADTSRTSPDVTTLPSHVPSRSVQHLRGQENHRNFSNVVCGATDTGAQSAKTDGRRLSDDRVRDWTEGTSVYE